MEWRFSNYIVSFIVISLHFIVWNTSFDSYNYLFMLVWTYRFQFNLMSYNGWIASLTHGHSLSKLQGIVKDRESWHTAVHEVAKH